MDCLLEDMHENYTANDRGDRYNEVHDSKKNDRYRDNDYTGNTGILYADSNVSL